MDQPQKCNRIDVAPGPVHAADGIPGTLQAVDVRENTEDLLIRFFMTLNHAYVKSE